MKQQDKYVSIYSSDCDFASTFIVEEWLSTPVTLRRTRIIRLCTNIPVGCTACINICRHHTCHISVLMVRCRRGMQLHGLGI